MPIDPSGQDAYFEANSNVPRNLYGITDPSELDILAGLTALTAAVQVRQMPPPAVFDLQQLRQYHRDLFGDVYPWAGDLRLANVLDPNGQTSSAVATPVDLVATRTQVIFEQLGREHDLMRTIGDPAAWADRAAYFYGELGRTLPFFDGNARTIAVLVDHLATDAGHDLDWSRLSRPQITAMHQALQADPDSPDREPLRHSMHLALGLPLAERTAERLELLDDIDTHLGIEAAAAELLHDPSIDPSLSAALTEDWPHITAATTALIVDEQLSRETETTHHSINTQIGHLALAPTTPPALQILTPRRVDPQAADELAARAAALKTRRQRGAQRPPHAPPPPDHRGPTPGPRR